MLDAVGTRSNGHGGAGIASGGKRSDHVPSPKTITEVMHLLRGNKQVNSARVTVWLTPPLATELLAKNHPRNRAISQATLRKYIRELESKRFRYTPSPIIINGDGVLGDGQHRCSMVAQTAGAILVDIVQMFNEEEFETARLLVDTGKTRTRGHVLEIAGIVPAGKGALANSILTHIGYFHDAIDTTRSNMEQVATFRPWAAAINAALVHTSRKWTIAMKAAFAVCFKHNPGTTEELFAQYEAGTDLKNGMPSHALVTMQTFFATGRGKDHDKTVMQFVFKAAHKQMTGALLRMSSKSQYGYSTRPSPFALDYFFGEHLRAEWRERGLYQRHAKGEE